MVRCCVQGNAHLATAAMSAAAAAVVLQALGTRIFTLILSELSQLWQLTCNLNSQKAKDVCVPAGGSCALHVERAMGRMLTLMA